MNERQRAFADADPQLGHLLVQLDTHYQQLPEAVRTAFDELGTQVAYGCHCDLEPGMEPDGCVLDSGRPQDCIHARSGMSKAEYQYWRPVLNLGPAESDQEPGATA